MFDVLKTLSTLVKAKKQGSTSVPSVKPSGADEPSLPKAFTKKEDVKVHGEKKAEKAEKIDEKAVAKEVAVRIAMAEAKAKEILFEAKDEAYRMKRTSEDELRRKAEAIDHQEGAIAEREKRVNALEVENEKKGVDIEKKRLEWQEKISQLSHMTDKDAKDFVIAETREKLKGTIAKEIKEALIKAEEESEVKAREILVDAMRHGVNDYIAEYTVSVVKLTDEEMKGRIIGKEGRNIRAFETATGVDVDLDEEGVIRLSCFDPVRREIARIVLERLMKDGRVQPGRIEELVEQVKKELERIMFEEGQKLCHLVGVYNLPSPIVALLGRFKYRFSYGQNMIAHTLEETKIGIAIAKEIGADANIVRLGCLLHDIGKVITDKEGSHVELGVEMLKKYGLPGKVIDCVAQHHEDTPFSSSESVITYIADAISGGRPGARYENYDEYVKRLTQLEDIAKAHPGVKESFAFQAGRELRVLVDPGKVDDADMVILAQALKEEIEEKVTIAGQVKVTVIREMRAVETAR